VVAVPAGEAASLTAIGIGTDSNDSPPRGSGRGDPVDIQSVLAVMMAVDVADQLVARIVEERETDRRVRPACVAPAATNDQAAEVSVELQVRDFDRCAAALDRNHVAIG